MVDTMNDLKLEYILSSPDVDDGIYFEDTERKKFLDSCKEKGIATTIPYPIQEKIVYKTKVVNKLKFRQNYIKVYPTWIEFIKYKLRMKR